MENFVVSARKYRPLGFEEVVGQEHITTTLENAINSNHLGQALLFCGPRGVGKTTCARILAKTINDFESESGEGNNNFNIFELDAASNNSVEDIRNLIDQVRYPPQQGKYKVYIIDEVHMLSTQAFNAFLKTLEEPPEYAIFILATTEKHKVIPTILSRCQIYDFNRIEVTDIVKQLEKIAASEKVEAEKEALHLIAQKADGALRDALSIFDLITTFSSEGKITYQDTIKNLHILDYDYYFKLVEDLLAQNMSGALMLFDEILRNGFDGNNFLNGFQQHLRNLLVAKDNQTIQLLEVTDNLKTKYAEQSGKCSPSFLLSALNISNQFELNFKQSKNQRLHVELCLMKLAHLPDALSLSSSNNGAKKKRLASEKEQVTGHKPQEAGSESQVPETKHQASIPKSEGSIEESKPKEQTPPPVSETPLVNKADSHLPSEPDMPPPPTEEPHQSVNSSQEVKSVPKPKPSPIVRPSTSGKPKETPSIFGKKKNKEATEEASPVIDKKETDFSDEDLIKAWEAYSAQKADAGDTERLVLSKSIKKGENHSVVLMLGSQLEVSFLEKFDTELVQFLRNELQNDHIVIRTEIAEIESEKKLYTSTDIFDYMVKQNPDLKDLKDRLGLDFDY